MNKVMLIGHLGSDPELRFTPNGRPVARLRLATNEKWKNEDGSPGERTDWHTIDVWGALAENVSRYLTKGRQVAVEGRLQYDRVAQPDGGEDKWYTKIVASRVEFLGSGNGNGSSVSEEPAAEEEIPF